MPSGIKGAVSLVGMWPHWLLFPVFNKHQDSHGIELLPTGEISAAP